MYCESAGFVGARVFVLLAQIARVLEINDLEKITLPVVQAARESLVIGTA